MRIFSSKRKKRSSFLQVHHHNYSILPEQQQQRARTSHLPPVPGSLQGAQAVVSISGGFIPGAAVGGSLFCAGGGLDFSLVDFAPVGLHNKF